MGRGAFPLYTLAVTLFALSCTDAYQKHSIDWNGDIRECYGTFNGMGISGDAHFRYEELRQRYTGCNRVLGNLEISFLDDPHQTYDLSFLSEIREVTGHVIIVGNIVREIPLIGLEAIRGFPLFFYKKLETNVALFVSLNYRKGIPNVGLQQLRLPRLREITKGGVLVEKNRDLCYIDTINWDNFERVRPEADTIVENRMGCPPCSKTCSNSTTRLRHCWGPGQQDCQRFQPGSTGPPPIVPRGCESQVQQICKTVSQELTQTVNTLMRNLKDVRKKARKLTRALKGASKPKVASGRAD